MGDYVAPTLLSYFSLYIYFRYFQQYNWFVSEIKDIESLPDKNRFEGILTWILIE